MGRQFGLSGEPCVYCHGARFSTRSGDHVFARQFFAEERRANLPKVPACLECNGEKSQLEHYLTAVLPNVGCHQDAKAARSMAASRLAANERLRRELEEGRQISMIRVAPGVASPSTTVPFDGDRLLSFFRFAAKGLLWHHWGITLAEAHDVFAGCVIVGSEAQFTQYFAAKSRAQVREDLGSGTFRYEGTQHVDDPQFSIWKFMIHERITMTAPGGEADHPLQTIVAISGKRDLVQQVTRQLRR
jgi:hypothetical protein